MSFLAAKAKKVAHFGTDAVTNRVFMRKYTLSFGLSICKKVDLEDGLKEITTG